MLEPVEFDFKEEYPTAVLDSPSVFWFNDLPPTAVLLLPDKLFSNELEPVIKNIGELNIGNEGYAVNPFNPINNGNPFLKYNENFQDVLNAELKDKLSEPNLGLRITKRKKLD